MCLVTGQEQRSASHELAGSQQIPNVMAGVPQWVQEGSRWHTAPSQQRGVTDDDSSPSDLERRVSELAGMTQYCNVEPYL